MGCDFYGELRIRGNIDNVNDWLKNECRTVLGSSINTTIDYYNDSKENGTIEILEDDYVHFKSLLFESSHFENVFGWGIIKINVRNGFNEINALINASEKYKLDFVLFAAPPIYEGALYQKIKVIDGCIELLESASPKDNGFDNPLIKA